MTDLRFIGDWRLWGGLAVGLGLAAAAWLLYWRETRARSSAVRWVLPTLRAAAVLLLVLMLTGPVLHHRNIIGEVARILLFVDASASMSITDQEMELPRKLFIAQQLGWLATNKFDPDLRAAAAALANAQETAARAKPNLPAPQFHEFVRGIAWQGRHRDVAANHGTGRQTEHGARRAVAQACGNRRGPRPERHRA